jgi:hypothetical protein
LQKDELTRLAQECIGHGKPIELVAMDRKMPLAAIFPGIFLINGDADQMRHDLSEPMVMVSLNPHDFNAMPRI